MRAISIRDPWASLIMLALKSIETRPRKTKYRGLLAIHASQRFDTDIRGGLERRERVMNLLGTTKLSPGCVLGTVELVDCVPVEELLPTLSARERLLGDYSPGRFGWLLRDPQPLPVPVPARGMLSFWEWDIVTNKEAR